MRAGMMREWIRRWIETTLLAISGQKFEASGRAADLTSFVRTWITTVTKMTTWMFYWNKWWWWIPSAGGRGSDALSSTKVTWSIVSATDRCMARDAALMCTSATSWIICNTFCSRDVRVTCVRVLCTQTTSITHSVSSASTKIHHAASHLGIGDAVCLSVRLSQPGTMWRQMLTASVTRFSPTGEGSPWVFETNFHALGPKRIPFQGL